MPNKIHYETCIQKFKRTLGFNLQKLKTNILLNPKLIQISRND